jgi:hypothetical protein
VLGWSWTWRWWLLLWRFTVVQYVTPCSLVEVTKVSEEPAACIFGRRRQRFSPECWYLSTKLHNATTQKTTAVRTPHSHHEDGDSMFIRNVRTRVPCHRCCYNQEHSMSCSLRWSGREVAYVKAGRLSQFLPGDTCENLSLVRMAGPWSGTSPNPQTNNRGRYKMRVIICVVYSSLRGARIV